MTMCNEDVQDEDADDDHDDHDDHDDDDDVKFHPTTSRVQSFLVIFSSS